MEMSNSTRYIKLTSAILAALASCAFVSIYSKMSSYTQVIQDQGSRPFIADMLVLYAHYAYVVPVILLIIGLWSILRKNDVALELLVALAWLFAFVWLAYTLLAWRTAEVPVLRLRAMLQSFQ